MSNEDTIARVAALIGEQRDLRLNERLAELMRASAFLAVTEIEGVTAVVFGDAAALCGYHRQSSMNRFNESKLIWGDEFRFAA